MSVAVRFVSANKSNVLQQANTNVAVAPVAVDVAAKPVKEEDAGKMTTTTTTTTTTSRRKRRASRENENCLDGVGKVRRPFHSSSQRGGPASSDETGEEDEDEDEDDDEEERGARGRSRTHPRPIIPNYVTKNDTGQYRRRKTSSRCGSDPGKTSHLSMSIAKRNARERNRVKLVNQGFATLRSRIPDYISEMYTEERKKKKVSKVETLRMALGYIRHLTDMLELRGSAPEDCWFRDGTAAGYDVSVASVGTTASCFNDDPPIMEEEEEVADAEGMGHSLILNENSFSVDVGCCYDLDQTDGGSDGLVKEGKLPSITETFPRKSIRLLYETPPFLSETSAFHV